MTNRCYVYIMANPRSRVLYTGMTCNLEERIASGEIQRIVRARRISQSRNHYTILTGNSAPPPLRVRGGLATLEMTGCAS
jgi:hypothetical protein